MDTTNVILAKILADAAKTSAEQDFLHRTRAKLRDYHFDDKYDKLIWRAIGRYYIITNGSAPTAEQIRHLLEVQQVKDDITIPVTAKLDVLDALHPTDNEAIFALAMLVEGFVSNRFKDLLATSAEILVRGRRVEGVRREGLGDALAYLKSSLVQLDPSIATTSDGDVLDEIPLMAREYARAKEGSSTLFRTGIGPIDGITGGLDRGDLMLMAAYIGEGKSMLLVNIAHAAMMQGLNVAYLTNETSRNVTRRRLLVRHSNEGIFSHPLSYTNLRFGQLNMDDEDLLANVLSDLASNTSYGRCFCWQLPTSITMPQIHSKLLEYDQLHELGLVCIDSLHLIGAEEQTQDTWAVRSVVIAGKKLATGFDGGRGIAMASPWHVTRNAWRDAQTSGYYQKGDLGLSAEADKSADIIMGMYRDPDARDTIKCSFQKVREEDEGQPFLLRALWDHSYIFAEEAIAVDFGEF